MTIENAPKISIEQVAELSARVIQEVEKAVVGKRDVLNLMMAALLSSGGHILLEDYPGLVVNGGLTALMLIEAGLRQAPAAALRRYAARTLRPLICGRPELDEMVAKTEAVLADCSERFFAA